MPGVNPGPEERQDTPFGIEVDPAVRGDRPVVLRQRAEETIELLEPESLPMYLMQGGQCMTDGAPVAGCSILRRAFGQRLSQQKEPVIYVDETCSDRCRYG